VSPPDASLWGPTVTPEVERILNVGLEEIPADRLTVLADDLYRAQSALIGAAWRAAVESGRVSAVCPDTPDEMLDTSSITFRIHKEPEP
jgi:hypothetical protein